MLFPWFTTATLAIESSDVVGLRMMRMAFGEPPARRKAEVMVSEKVDALVEAAGSLCGGATPAIMVDRYREHVAANAASLAV